MGALNILNVIAATLLGVVVISNLVLMGLLYLSPGGTPSAACISENSNCTLSVLHDDGTCGYRALARDVPCQDTCYVGDSTSTMCNAIGECVGNSSECRGTCPSQDEDGAAFCAQAIPLDLDYWYDRPDLGYFIDGVEIILDYAFSCKFHQCGAYVLIETSNDASHPSVVTGGGASGNDPCLGYVNQTFLRTNNAARCIATRYVQLEQPLTDFALDGRAQLSVCLYQYACSKLDYAMLMDDFNDIAGPTGNLATSAGTLQFTSTGATVLASNLTAAASLVQQADSFNTARRGGRRLTAHAPAPTPSGV